MARTKKSAEMDSPTKRKSLAAGDYHQEPLPAGGYLKYRCPAKDKVGSWFVQDPDPVTGKLAQAKIAVADDDLKRPADGVAIMTYAQAREIAEARVKVRAKARKQAAGGDQAPDKLRTVRDVMAYYIRDAKATRKNIATALSTEESANANILPQLGDVLVEELTGDVIEKWRDELAGRGRRKTGWTRKEGEAIIYLPLIPAKRAKTMTKAELAEATELAVKRRKSSANRELALLKAALNLAVEKRKIPVDHAPWAQVELFKGVKGQRVRFLVVTEQVRLVNACPEDFRQLVCGALYTGARYAELAATKVMDFDAANGSLRVEGKGQDTKVRHIFLTKEGTVFFSGLVAGRAGGELIFIRHGVERGSRKDLKNADGWLKDDVKTPMKRACKDAQIEPLVFHELRHTYASSLIAENIPLMVVAAQLGHADTRMVEKHYGHLAPSATKDTIRKMAPQLGISGVAKVAELEIKKA